MSPLDYAIEHGEDGHDEDRSDDDAFSDDSEFSYDSDEINVRAAKAAAADAAQAKRRRQASGVSGQHGGAVAKRARKEGSESYSSSARARTTGTASAGASGDSDDDFESISKGVTSSGANVGKTKGHVLLVDRYAAKPGETDKSDKASTRHDKVSSSSSSSAISQSKEGGHRKSDAQPSSVSVSAFGAGAGAGARTDCNGKGGEGRSKQQKLLQPQVPPRRKLQKERFESHYVAAAAKRATPSKGSMRGGVRSVGVRAGQFGHRASLSDRSLLSAAGGDAGRGRLTRVADVSSSSSSSLLQGGEGERPKKKKNSTAGGSGRRLVQTQLPLFRYDNSIFSSSRHAHTRTAAVAAGTPASGGTGTGTEVIDIIEDDDDDGDEDEDEDDDDFIEHVIRARAIIPPVTPKPTTNAAAGATTVQKDMGRLFSELAAEATGGSVATTTASGSDNETYDTTVQRSLVDSVADVVAQAMSVASVQLRALSDGNAGGNAKGIDSRVDRATTLLLLLLSSSNNYAQDGGGTAGPSLALLLPRMAQLEQYQLFCLLSSHASPPNVSLYAPVERGSKDGGLNGTESSPLTDGGSLATLLYEASIDPLHDNIVCCVLHYIGCKAQGSVSSLQGMLCACNGSGVTSEITEATCTRVCTAIRAVEAVLSRCWDDLALTIALNPALLAMCLRVSSHDGVAAICDDDSSSSTSSAPEEGGQRGPMLSFKDWMVTRQRGKHKGARHAHGYDASRPLGLLRYWYTLTAASFDFSHALGSPIAKAVLAANVKAGAGNNSSSTPYKPSADLAAFKSNPWASLVRRLAGLFTAAGLPHTGPRLSAFRPSPQGGVVVAGGSSSSSTSDVGTLVAVNPYLSAHARKAAVLLRVQNSANSALSGEALWMVLALHSLLLHHHGNRNNGKNATPTRIRSLWSLAELLLTHAYTEQREKQHLQTVAMLSRPLKRTIALAGMWDECAEGARIVLTECQKALSGDTRALMEAAFSLVLKEGERRRLFSMRGNALEAAAASVLSPISSYPESINGAGSFVSKRLPLPVMMGQLVAALYHESGFIAPISIVSGGASAGFGELARDECGVYEGMETLPSGIFSFLRKVTTAGSSGGGATVSKIMVKRLLAVLRKKETSLSEMLAGTRATVGNAAFAPSENGQHQEEDLLYSPEKTERTRQMAFLARSTTTLLLLAASAAALGPEALHPGGSAQKDEAAVLSTVLPWGEDEAGGGDGEVAVKLPRELHACLMWLVALIVYHPTSLGQPVGPNPDVNTAPVAAGDNLTASLAPLTMLLRSLPVIIDAEHAAAATETMQQHHQHRKRGAVTVPLSEHCTRQLLISLSAGGSVLHTLSTTPVPTTQTKEYVWGLLQGPSSVATLTALALKHGPPRTALGCAGIRTAVITLRAMSHTLLLTECDGTTNVAAASTTGTLPSRATLLRICTAGVVAQLVQALPKLMSGGNEAGANYDMLAAPTEESKESIGIGSAMAGSSRRSGHLHALALAAVSALGDWVAAIVSSSTDEEDKSAVNTAAIATSSLLSVPSFDSPLPHWLLSVLWTPILRSAVHRARSDEGGEARAVKAICLPHLLSLHCVYLTLLATNVVQRKVTKTLESGSFEMALADATALCATCADAGNGDFSTTCATFWHNRDGNKQLLHGITSVSSILPVMMDLSTRLASQPGEGAKAPMTVVCAGLMAFCRFINQMAFHSDQRSRDYVLLPFATEIKFKVLLGCAVTLGSGSGGGGALARKEHGALYDEGAGCKRDIDSADAMLSSLTLTNIPGAASTAGQILQYLPLVIRSSATRQYATVHRAWEPLLAMLARSCTGLSLWARYRHTGLYQSVLGTWAVALTPFPLVGISTTDSTAPLRRLIHGASSGITTLVEIHKHGCNDKAEDAASLQKLRGFAALILCNRDANEQFRSDCMWRRVVAEMVARDDCYTEESSSSSGGPRTTEKWLNATVVAARSRLTIARAACCVHFCPGSSRLEIVSGTEADIHVAVLISGVLLGLQLVRLACGDSPSEVDASYSTAVGVAHSESDSAAAAVTELMASLTLCIGSAEGVAAMAGDKDKDNEGEYGVGHNPHIVSVQRDALDRWCDFVKTVSCAGMPPDDSDSDSDSGSGNLAGVVDTLVWLLRRWICCATTSVSDNGANSSCACSACCSPLVWEAVEAQKAGAVAAVGRRSERDSCPFGEQLRQLLV